MSPLAAMARDKAGGGELLLATATKIRGEADAGRAPPRDGDEDGGEAGAGLLGAKQRQGKEQQAWQLPAEQSGGGGRRPGEEELGGDGQLGAGRARG